MQGGKGAAEFYTFMGVQKFLSKICHSTLPFTFYALIQSKGSLQKTTKTRFIMFGAKFSVMVNGVPAGFFPNSKGLQQGDPFSPYLFVLGMEVLSTLIRRAVDGGFLSGCRLQGRGGVELIVFHLLFVNDTVIFCETRKEQLTA